MKKILFLLPMLASCVHVSAQEHKVVNLALEQPDKVSSVRMSEIELSLEQPDEILLSPFMVEEEKNEPIAEIKDLTETEVELSFVGFSENINLSIYNMTGDCLKTEKIANLSDSFSHRTSLPISYSKIYFIKVESNNYRLTHKVLTK